MFGTAHVVSHLRSHSDRSSAEVSGLAADSCLGLDSSAPVPGSDSPQSLLWKVDMMDLIRHVGTLLQCIFCWLLGRGKKTKGQHLARPSPRSVVMVSTHMELKKKPAAPPAAPPSGAGGRPSMLLRAL